jgi:hypothetical protein
VPGINRQRINAFLLFLLFGLSILGTPEVLATVPSDYVELTSAAMKSRGFTFEINKDNDHAWIDLKFPGKIFSKDEMLVPLYTYVVVKDMAGDMIASTTNWVVKNDTLNIVSSYNPRLSDMSISINYGCPITGSVQFRCGTVFRISSVSKFFDENPDALNLPLKLMCTKVQGSTVEVFDCTE